MAKGSLYDYKRQCWTDVDSDTDRRAGKTDTGTLYMTPDGVLYEVHWSNPDLYRNA